MDVVTKRDNKIPKADSKEPKVNLAKIKKGLLNGARTILNGARTLSSKLKALPRKHLIAIGVASGIIVTVSTILIVTGLSLNQDTVPTTSVAPTTAYRSSYQFIGQSCAKSPDCLASGYCDASTLLCSCSPELYFETSTGTCQKRKTFGATCSQSLECEWNAFLQCTNRYCTCDVMLFWNSNTHQCEDKRGLGETCVGFSGECFASKMICTTFSGSPSQTRCICPIDTHFFSFFTGDCELRKGYAVFCNAHFECMDYGWCTPFPSDNRDRCQCIPNYYWDSATSQCYPKKTYQAACTFGYECMEYGLSLSCISNKCYCSSNAVWNGTHCNFLSPYAGPCTNTTDCMSYGTQCLWSSDLGAYECLCPLTSYFAISNSSCVPFKLLNEICADSSECFPNASCIFLSSSSDRRCLCTPTKYYANDRTACLSFKIFNQACNASSECNTPQGLLCVNGTCQCDTNYFYNNLRCEPRLSTNAATYSKYCRTGYDCKIAFGLTNCAAGTCSCESPKTWNGTYCA